jgi:hypothetical protein
MAQGIGGGSGGGTYIPDMAFWGLVACQVSDGSGYSGMASLDELGLQMIVPPPTLQDWKPSEDT